MLLSNFIQIEIWFTEVSRDLGGKCLDPAGRFRPIAVAQVTVVYDCYAAGRAARLRNVAC